MQRSPRGGTKGNGVASVSNGRISRRRSPGRRMIVVLVPPVVELDRVGPLQVFNSVNRLAGRTIYTIEVVTGSNRWRRPPDSAAS